jgi:hypothetical protein
MTETIAEAVLLLAHKFPPDWRNDITFAGKSEPLFWGGYFQKWSAGVLYVLTGTSGLDGQNICME